jgi:hypothetical protein
VNGRVSHLVLEQAKDGTIVYPKNAPEQAFELIESGNHFYFYLDANNPLFTIYGHWLGYNITLLHLIALGLSILLQILSFRKINRHIRDSKLLKRWSLRFLKLTLWLFLMLANIAVFIGIDYYQTQIHFRFHQIHALKGNSKNQLKNALENRTIFEAQPTSKLSFQLYIKNGKKWHTQREHAVLYFKMDNTQQLYFLRSSQFLNWRQAGYSQQIMRAQSQFIVIEKKDKKGNVHTVLYEPNGQKIYYPEEPRKDPAKRILLFVNGYRPVTSSQNLEKVKGQILQKGLEHPNSKNLIWRSDAYDYWINNGKILEQFIKRIEPDVVYYADGHHSIETSNHRNILNFASKASVYPQPCATKKHNCFTTAVAENQKIRTYDLLATQSNKEGFLQRYRSGKLAALNFLQEIQGLADFSANDTLYVVSHSMGHAYFCGMAAVLEKHIQFANYYALAPENANGRRFDTRKWRQIWQYGTVLHGKHKHPMCQQDGVAPQVKISGLPKRFQIGFPLNQNKRLGYFAAHYVGYFDWIFELRKEQPGAVQR